MIDYYGCYLSLSLFLSSSRLLGRAGGRDHRGVASARRPASRPLPVARRINSSREAVETSVYNYLYGAFLRLGTLTNLCAGAATPACGSAWRPLGGGRRGGRGPVWRKARGYI